MNQPIYKFLLSLIGKKHLGHGIVTLSQKCEDLLGWPQRGRRKDRGRAVCGCVHTYIVITVNVCASLWLYYRNTLSDSMETYPVANI